MREDYTDISLLLDRSGSMQSIWADTMGGIARFLEDQRKLPGQALLSMSVFDSEYINVYSGLAVQVATTPEAYGPRGGTALYDGIVRLLGETRERLGKLNEDEKPANVLIVIVTDGGENESREATRPLVKEAIEQAEKAGWKILYLGASLDLTAEAEDLGMRGVLFNASPVGVMANFAYANAYIGSTRLSTQGTADERSAYAAVAHDLYGAADVDAPSTANSVAYVEEQLKKLEPKSKKGARTGRKPSLPRGLKK